MRPYIIYPGDRFNWLTVIRLDPRLDQYRCICKCRCGNKTSVLVRKLVTGHVKSCGCLWKLRCTNLTHGHSKNGNTSTEYTAWKNMIARCYRVTHPSYPYYGERGIAVCKRWRGKNGFINFLADMGHKPKENLTIERINNNGDYKPNNCRWKSRRFQQNNRRSNIIVSFHGRKITLAQASRKSGIPYDILRGRYHKGWSGSKLFE